MKGGEPRIYPEWRRDVSRFLGDVRQSGYVVPNIEVAMAHWAEVLGVGPFFYFERVPIEDFHYNGRPSPLDVSIALANSGSLQIELIQQRNDAPSMYRSFLEREPSGGLQHVAYWSDSFDCDLDYLQEAGYGIGQSGCIGEGGRFVYLATKACPGTVVELSEISGAKGRFFEFVATQAVNWDGTDPIRPL